MTIKLSSTGYCNSSRSKKELSFSSQLVGIYLYVVVLFGIISVTTSARPIARSASPSPSVDVCLVNTDCTTCITQDQCGFCQETGLCLTGDVNGPGGNPNNCTEWFFLECPSSPCSSLTTCATCVADSLCGWCFTTQLCEPGTKSGPVTGTCTNFAFGNVKLCKPKPSPSRTPSRTRKPIRRRSHTPFPSRSRKPIRRRSHTPFPSRSRKPIRLPSRTPFPSRVRISHKLRKTKIPITTIIVIHKSRKPRKPRRSHSPSPTHTRTHSPSPSPSPLESSASLASKPIYLIFYLLLASFSIGVVTRR
jgi:hypothetical protein